MNEHTKDEISLWNEHLTQTVKSETRREAYIEYARRLLSDDLPVLFSLAHLSRVTGLKTEILASQIFHSHKYYREFDIPKRSGGFRTISTPYPSLLHGQRWIQSHILHKVSVHKAAHGFALERSVVTNAAPHLGKRWVLKLDLKSFFPSVHIRRIVAIFKRCGYARDISFFLARLCCLHDSLPQGAATSPVLSNIVFKKTDTRLSALSSKYDLAYTRYADDITFSGCYIPSQFILLVSEIIESEGFAVNPKKTRLVGPKGRKIVTGVSVSGETLKLPRQTRRMIRQEVFHLRTKGFMEHTAARKIADPLYAERILGKLAFWRQVEPENGFVTEAIIEVNKVRSQLNQLVPP